MPAFIDLTGRRFGKLVVLERAGTEKLSPLWKCACDCGNQKLTTSKRLLLKPKPRRLPTRSCGCLQDRTIDLVGQRFGRLLVLERDLAEGGPKGGANWKCLCDCGKTKIINASCLKKTRKSSPWNGSTVSCGCWRTERARRDSLVHGRTETSEFRAWQAMKSRCMHPENLSWPRYGGRGISIFRPWIGDFMAFYNYVGPRPSPSHSLDRIDNNGNYEPGNVRWATRREQAHNRSTTKLSDTDVAFVRHWRARGYKLRPIAQAFGLNISYARAVCKGHVRRVSA